MRQEIDGPVYRLPPRRESPARWGAGMLLIAVAGVDTLIVVAILGIVLPRSTQSLPQWALGLILVGVVLGGVALAIFGLWLMAARAEIAIERERLAAVTRIGPLRRRTSMRLDELAYLALKIDKPPGVNVPGGFTSSDFLELRAHSDRGRGVTLASGYHRRLLEPLAHELCSVLGVDGPVEVGRGEERVGR